MRTSSSPLGQNAVTPRSFALKGGLFPLTLLELLHHDLDELEQELMLKAKQAPGFFNQAPAILSVEHIDSAVDINLAAIKAMCQQAGISIVAMREAHSDVNTQARGLNLAVLPKSRARTVGHRPTEIDLTVDSEDLPSAAGREATARELESNEAKVSATLPDTSVLESIAGDVTSEPSGTKLITQPIRSGQQVYAPGGDLVVTAPVSAGAELLADGNIHVYGALRGRALAGVKGDSKARIFCQQMEAELMSIAGHFKMEEELSETYKGKPVQVFLRDHSLVIEALSAKDR
jgi:septum site-determining protein MinC